MKDIEIRARDMLVGHLGVEPEQIVRSASFIDDLGADSLDTVEIVMNAEETFGIEIPDEEADEVRTFGELVDLIERKLS